MAVVTINGVEKEYPIGTSYQEIAKEYQPSMKMIFYWSA